MLPFCGDEAGVEAILNYGGAGDFFEPKLLKDLPAGCDVNMHVHNARRVASSFTFDRNGFQLVIKPTSLSKDEFLLEDKVTHAYYAEICEMVKSVTGASRVACSSFLLRSKNGKRRGDTSSYPYGAYVHNDYTLEEARRAAKFQASRHFGLTDVEFEGCRCQLLNVWRSIDKTEPVQDNHLALCDAVSLSPEDYNFDDGRYLHPAGKHRHQWYYYPHIMNHELLLFKQWDSASSTHTGCFHSSFTDPSAITGRSSRESIEVRVVAIYDSQQECELQLPAIDPRGTSATDARGKSCTMM